MNFTAAARSSRCVRSNSTHQSAAARPAMGALAGILRRQIDHR